MLANAAARATLPASDMKRAKKFYQETLGLKVKEENPGGVRFECGDGTEMAVYPSGFAGTNQATAAEFEVQDIEAEMSELKDKGVTFEEYDLPDLKTENGVATFDKDKGAWFKDTEGNILALFQKG